MKVYNSNYLKCNKLAWSPINCDLNVSFAKENNGLNANVAVYARYKFTLDLLEVIWINIRKPMKLPMPL